MAITLTRPASQLDPEPKRKRFTRDEYYSLADNGLLAEGRRYELIDGDVVEKMGQKEPHPSLVVQLLFALSRVFGEAFVRCQAPIVLSDDTEPEPDVVVTAIPSDVSVAASTTPNATDVTLVAEISVSTVSYDLKTKASIYARAGIAEYWALDVAGRRLIVHRDPTPDGYSNVVSYSGDETISPLDRPEAVFKVSDYLP